MLLSELKKEDILTVKWIAGSKNDSDKYVHHKIGRALFKIFALVYVSKDEYSLSAE